MPCAAPACGAAAAGRERGAAVAHCARARRPHWRRTGAGRAGRASVGSWLEPRGSVNMLCLAAKLDGRGSFCSACAVEPGHAPVYFLLQGAMAAPPRSRVCTKARPAGAHCPLPVQIHIKRPWWLVDGPHATQTRHPTQNRAPLNKRTPSGPPGRARSTRARPRQGGRVAYVLVPLGHTHVGAVKRGTAACEGGTSLRGRMLASMRRAAPAP